MRAWVLAITAVLLSALAVIPLHVFASAVTWQIAPHAIYPGALVVTAVLMALLAAVVAARRGVRASVLVLVGAALGGWLLFVSLGTTVNVLAGRVASASLVAQARSSFATPASRRGTVRYVAYPALGSALGILLGLAFRKARAGERDSAR